MGRTLLSFHKLDTQLKTALLLSSNYLVDHLFLSN